MPHGSIADAPTFTVNLWAAMERLARDGINVVLTPTQVFQLLADNDRLKEKANMTMREFWEGKP